MTAATPRDKKRVAKLFLRLAAIYGPAWSSHYSGDTGILAMAEWGDELVSLTDEQVRRGIDRCRRRIGFPPSLPEFRQLCLLPWDPSQIASAVSRAMSHSHLPLDEIEDSLTRELVRLVPPHDRRKLSTTELSRRFSDGLAALVSAATEQTGGVELSPSPKLKGDSS